MACGGHSSSHALPIARASKWNSLAQVSHSLLNSLCALSAPACSAQLRNAVPRRALASGDIPHPHEGQSAVDLATLARAHVLTLGGVEHAPGMAECGTLLLVGLGLEPELCWFAGSLSLGPVVYHYQSQLLVFDLGNGLDTDFHN